MTVKEMIDKLLSMPMDADILFVVGYKSGIIEKVSYNNSLNIVYMEEFVACTACGKDTFIVYRSSIECSNCSKTYYFNNTRYFNDIIDLVKDMD